MNFDSFTISRYIFLAFIILISVYFIVENKKQKKIENFASETTQASSGIGATDSSKITAPTTAPTTAPKGGSTESLDGKNKQGNDPKDPLPKAPPEYITKDDASVKKAVIQAYQELYQTPPEKEELDFYTEYVKSRNVTKEQLKEVIETSAPTLQKTFYSKRNANTPDEIFGMENEIIEVYNELLDRNPDRRELYSFAKMMKEDANFNLDKLRQVLIASEEFKRMERTQNNKVYVNLQSNITDRQLTMQVSKIYTNVTGQDYLDEDTLKFLKKKFVEFELNEKIMTEFITNYVSNKPFQPTKPQVAVQEQSKEDAKKASDAQMAEIKKQILDDIQKQNQAQAQTQSQAQANTQKAGSSNQKEKFQDGANVYNDAKIFNFFGKEGANDEVISSLMSQSVNKNGNIDTSSMISSIKGSTCNFSKDYADLDMLAKNKQELSDYVNGRNMSHLKNVCQRNKKYMNADENMVLFPEYKWSVPQQYPPVCTGKNQQVNPMIDQTALIGTLLTDAKDTKVGSLLPTFPPV